MSEIQHRSLYQVVNYLKGLIDSNLANKRFWLKAEISNIGSKNGHYYIDLVEHKDGKIIAQCKACIWSYSVQNIKAALGSDFDHILKKGAEVLVNVDVRFNEVFGLQLIINSVDKSYALGELEKRKRETYERLKSEGLLELNKRHLLPTVLQRLAVLGSPNTSGLTDLLKQLHGNEFGYRYEVTNFPCSVQGEKAEAEIITQFNLVTQQHFDAVIVVRGGGSKLDLEVFNSFNVASAIARLSLPVLTGIGHETDISIVDLTANQYFKTPSAVGAYIVAKSREYEVRVQTIYTNVSKLYEHKLQLQKHRIQQASLSFSNSSISYTQLRRGALSTMGNRILTLVRANIADQKLQQQKAVQVIGSACDALFVSKRNRFEEIANLCEVKSNQILDAQQRHVSHQNELLALYVGNFLKKQNDKLRHSAEVVDVYHPNNTLERGYAVVRVDGIVVTPKTKLGTGDGIEIELIDRKIRATVISESPKVSKWKTLITKVLQKS